MDMIMHSFVMSAVLEAKNQSSEAKNQSRDVTAVKHRHEPSTPSRVNSDAHSVRLPISTHTP